MRTLTAAIVLVLASSLFADVKLPTIFSDNMVLQQGSPIRVWGWAAPGEAVTVRLRPLPKSDAKPYEQGKSYDGESRQTKADEQGDWSVELKPFRATAEAMELTVAGKNTLTIKNVLVGEVWVCSGQSNMYWPLIQSRDAQQEVKDSDYPQIRMFTVENIAAPVPVRDVPGKWELSSPQTSGHFSAVGYFFARALHKDLKVPVGMIHTSWGATSAEPWTSREGLANVPWFQKTLQEYDEYTKAFEGVRDDAKYRDLGAKMTQKWITSHRHADPGNKGFDLGYAKGDFDDKDWKEIEMPQMFQAAGYKCNGAFWARKVIELPKSAEGKDLELSLGCLDDFDTAYFNGVKVGATGRDVPDAYSVRRKYPVPGKLVQAGRNVIAVRVFDWAGDGGFNPVTKDLLAVVLGDPKSDKPAAISLVGKWKVKVELELPQVGFVAPPGTQNSICGLYNGMVAPFVKYPIRGAIWYQGESNSLAAIKYRTTFPALIKDWRAKWGQPDMPFLFVQLANFMARQGQPSESCWAELREAQMMTLALPHTGMAVIIDIGDADDIHPKNKQDVGKRLELAALAQAYGKKLVYSGPIYKSMKVEDGKVRLSFEHVGGGLEAIPTKAQMIESIKNSQDVDALQREFDSSSGEEKKRLAKELELRKKDADDFDKKAGRLVGFAIAGEDRKFIWAEAKIEGNKVVVWSDKVAKPLAVRYAWADNPQCNLYNKEGLPASPFRTDDWPVTTSDK